MSIRAGGSPGTSGASSSSLPSPLLHTTSGVRRSASTRVARTGARSGAGKPFVGDQDRTGLLLRLRRCDAVQTGGSRRRLSLVRLNPGDRPRPLGGKRPPARRCGAPGDEPRVFVFAEREPTAAGSQFSRSDPCQSRDTSVCGGLSYRKHDHDRHLERTWAFVTSTGLAGETPSMTPSSRIGVVKHVKAVGGGGRGSGSRTAPEDFRGSRAVEASGAVGTPRRV